MNNIKVTGIAILVIAIIGGLAYGGFYIKRTVNYHWYYQDAVQSDIQKAVGPLKDRIQKLEWEVANLKTNR